MDSEPPLLRTASAELSRLWRRTSRRRAAVLLITICIAVVGGYASARAPAQYSAQVVVRIVEGGVRSEVPMSAGELRRHILDVAFSGPRLLAMIRRLGIFSQELEIDPRAAITQLREGTTLTVWQPVFLEGGSGTRPARVTIAYSSSDRTIVLPIARGLAALLVDSEAAERRADLEARALNAASAVKRAVAEANEVRRLETSDTVAAGRVRTLAAAAEKRLREAQTAAVAADLRLRAAREAQDLRFDVADDGREPLPGPSFLLLMMRNFMVAAVVSWPVWMLLFGAFGSRVTGSEDAARMGLSVLGSVPGRPKSHV